MIEAAHVDMRSLGMTTQMIAKEILAREWQLWFVHPEFSFMHVRRTDGYEFDIFSTVPPTTSFAASKIANNKYATHILYRDAGLPVAQTHLFMNPSDLFGEAMKLLSRHTALVIKPLDAAHGNGVTTNIKTEEDIKKAVKVASEVSDKLLLQEHLLDQTDIRILCIDFKFVAALVRVTAEVSGDGQHSIAELITMVNAHPTRGDNYSKELNKIPNHKAAAHLGDLYHDIPEKGQVISVVGTANVGTGGTTIDITEGVPDWMKRQAEKAAHISQLPVCGVDFLVKDTPTTSSTIEQLQPHIIEINACPSLFIHETPTIGVARPVVAAYVDYLQSL